MTTHGGGRFVVLRTCAWVLTLLGVGHHSSREAIAQAGEFVVENQVYDGKQALGGSTTIFVGGKAYDFLQGSTEAVVFDPASGKLVLADVARRVRSELTLQELSEFVDRLRERALRGGSDFARFVAQPEFGERLDADTNELVLSSPVMEYRARTTSPKNAEVLKSYQAFAHWQAQLNCVVNPGALPPHARLKLNDALARRQLLPERVTMRRTTDVPGGGKLLRAEHSYTWRLDDDERRRAADLEAQVAAFRVVAIGEYLTPAETARATK